MASVMKLLIIGHSVVDNIYQNNITKIKPGGIFYTCSALNSLKTSSDEFHLVTGLAGKNVELFQNVFEKFDLSLSTKIESFLNVKLTVHNDGERDEVFVNTPKSLQLKNLNFDEYDGILINMIAGNDINTEQLEEIRKNFNGEIYIDIHALAKADSKTQNREFGKIVNPKLWLENVDIVQLNDQELLAISEGDNELERIGFIFNYRPKIVIVTKSYIGVTLYIRNDGEIFSIYVPAKKLEAKNFVGCGDVFGAFFFYNYILYGDYNVSLEMANRAAGLITTFNDYTDFENFPRVS